MDVRSYTTPRDTIGFSSYADMKLAQEAGITDPEIFKVKRDELLIAAEAKKAAEAAEEAKKQQAEIAAAEAKKAAEAAEEAKKQQAEIAAAEAKKAAEAKEAQLAQEAIAKEAAEEKRKAEVAAVLQAARDAAELAKKQQAEMAETAAKKKAEEAAVIKAMEEGVENLFYAPPPAQRAVMDAVLEAEVKYREAANDLAKGGVRRERARAICAAQPSRKIKGWTGTLKTLSTNGDGLGVVTVRLSDNLTVGTMNTALSDIGSNTLIDPDTAVFKKLASLKEGDRVKFSGSFVQPPDATDCFWETSLTMGGSMRDPEFVFRFSEIITYEQRE